MLKYEYIVVWVFIKDLCTKNSGKLLISVVLWVCNKTEKYKKMTKEGSFRKRFLTFFCWMKTLFWSKLAFVMPLNDIQIITQHLRSWSTFTLDAFLTAIDLIYKNLFNHQPFDGLTIIIHTIKLFAKNEYKFG